MPSREEKVQAKKAAIIEGFAASRFSRDDDEVKLVFYAPKQGLTKIKITGKLAARKAREEDALDSPV
jgi:hypothetical protein